MTSVNPREQRQYQAHREYAAEVSSIDVDEILDNSRTIGSIARYVAVTTGKRIQREGDSRSQAVIRNAYNDIYDLMRPGLVQHGPDETERRFELPVSHKTISDLTVKLSDVGMRAVCSNYASFGKYLELTPEGLVEQADVHYPDRLAAIRGGCPFAHSVHTKNLVEHGVAVYAEANRRGMNEGIVNVMARVLNRRG